MVERERESDGGERKKINDKNKVSFMIILNRWKVTVAL
jgi:hypothetical protein